MKDYHSKDEQMSNAVLAWMGIISILLGFTIIGLILAILKTIMFFLGIENNL